MRRRLLLILPLVAAGLLITGYLVASEILYRQLATVLPHCNGMFSTNSPAQFSTAPYNTDLDITPYLMPQYETVEIPSRDPGITLSSWFVPAVTDNAPAVLIIHGLGVDTADCKHHPRALFPAGILHRAGYNVLLIDLRQHGELDSHRWHVGGKHRRIPRCARRVGLARQCAENCAAADRLVRLFRRHRRGADCDGGDAADRSGMARQPLH